MSNLIELAEQLDEVANDCWRATRMNPQARICEKVADALRALAAPAVANGAAELPEPLEEVRAKFRGEWDYVEAGDRYYTQAQIVAYGQACAKAAAATNPLAPNALLVAALEMTLPLAERLCRNFGVDPSTDADFIAARAALASVPTAPEAT